MRQAHKAENPGTQPCLSRGCWFILLSRCFPIVTCICFWNISVFTWLWAEERKDMKFSVCTTLKCHLTACLDTKPRNDLVRLSANWHGTEDYLASWRAIFFSHTTNLTIYLAIVPILIPCTFCDIEQGPANFFYKGLDFKF